LNFSWYNIGKFGGRKLVRVWKPSRHTEREHRPLPGNQTPGHDTYRAGDEYSNPINLFYFIFTASIQDMGTVIGWGDYLNEKQNLVSNI